MSGAIYSVRYSGPFSEGGAVLYIGDGIVAGMDASEIVYDGVYNTSPSGHLIGTVVLTAKMPSALVTGIVVPAGQSIEIAFDLPPDFASGAPRQFSVIGTTVPATFTKIRDIP